MKSIEPTNGISDEHRDCLGMSHGWWVFAQNWKII